MQTQQVFQRIESQILTSLCSRISKHLGDCNSVGNLDSELHPGNHQPDLAVYGQGDLRASPQTYRAPDLRVLKAAISRLHGPWTDSGGVALPGGRPNCPVSGDGPKRRPLGAVLCGGGETLPDNIVPHSYTIRNHINPNIITPVYHIRDISSGT